MHTPVPLTLAIAHTTNSELGRELVLTEKISGVALERVRSGIDMETNSCRRNPLRVVSRLSDLSAQLREHQRCFDAIGNLHLREGIDAFNTAVYVNQQMMRDMSTVSTRIPPRMENLSNCHNFSLANALFEPVTCEITGNHMS